MEIAGEEGKKLGRISNDRRGGRKAAQGNSKTQAAVGIYLLIQGRF